MKIHIGFFLSLANKQDHSNLIYYRIYRCNIFNISVLYANMQGHIYGYDNASAYRNTLK